MIKSISLLFLLVSTCGVSWNLYRHAMHAIYIMVIVGVDGSAVTNFSPHPLMHFYFRLQFLEVDYAPYIPEAAFGVYLD
jgi:hypothetical protein